MSTVSSVFFCFKQKTAYEIEYGRVGSEMCIRDRDNEEAQQQYRRKAETTLNLAQSDQPKDIAEFQWRCLLYTSDAADERSSVDLGGRRIIKKKNT